MKTVQILITIIALFLLQFLFSSVLNILGIFPDIFLIFLAYLSLRVRPFWLIWIAFALGMLQDLAFNTALIGLSAVTKILFAWLLIKLSEYERSLNEIIYFSLVSILIAVFINLYDVLYFFGLAQEGLRYFTEYSMPRFLYTFVLFAVAHYFYPLVNRH